MGTESKIHNFKIVLLGEGCVGKTSIVLRYVEDKFQSKHISTLQASFLSKTIYVNEERINLNIWDTAGQERFHALGPIYYRSSNGAILVYDITDVDSFQKVKNWAKELKKMLGPEVVIAIAANKIDLDNSRNVTVEEGKIYSADVGARYIETSAKSNLGIEELFSELTKDMIANANNKSQNMTNASNILAPSRSLLVADEDSIPLQNTTTSKCCT